MTYGYDRSVELWADWWVSGQREEGTSFY
jgi:hypothetical protein